MTFDEVLPTLRRICDEEFDLDKDKLKRIFVLRDARAQIRICVEPKDSFEGDLVLLEAPLTAELGSYLIPPVLNTMDRGEPGRLARALLKEHLGLGFAPWPKEDKRWFKLERRLSKQEWLDHTAHAPAWVLSPDMPPVIAFYSFKGGVGRTTALLSCAWQLAAEDKHVAIVDLDLEAPGLGTLCCSETNARGVVDFLVDHLATGHADATDLRRAADELAPNDPEFAKRVSVYPAGSLSRDYLEKLARLDFMASELTDPGRASPVASALKELLAQIRRGGDVPPPDYIFLDSRAGLHDIAGLSLHGLAHLDVLVGRASQQSYQGMALATEMLTQRKTPTDQAPSEKQRYLVIHGMAPTQASDPSEETDSEERRFLDKSHEIFSATPLYRDTYQTLLDRTAPHFPVALHSKSDLERFRRIADVRDTLFSTDYRILLKTLLERLDRPDRSGEPA